MDKNLKVLVSGTGFAGQGHADAFRAVGVEVVGIVGRTESVVEEVAKNKGIPYFGTDWEKALKECQPDIVSIGTPGGAHYENITTAINYGCHVFCDKPLTDKGDSAIELRELAKNKGIKTALNNVFKHPLTLEDGHLLLQDKPGLGVDFEEKAAEKYTYKRPYLPVSRLKDGTLWNW